MRADGARIEEAGLNALQTQRQLFYDGWLLRLSPGSAKRGRSVNPHFGSTLPLADKIAYCERVYAAHDLPVLFRLTPFEQPARLDLALDAEGYLAFDRTLVQRAPLERAPQVDAADVDITAPSVARFVADVATLRGSTARESAAHLERLRETPLATFRVTAQLDGRVVGTAQAALDDRLVGIFDVHTAAAARGRGVATHMVARLLAWGWDHAASHAYLQVTADNAPALAVYRKFGFSTLYEYHYRGRPGGCR